MAAISTLKDGFQDNVINSGLWTTGFYEGNETSVTVAEVSQQAKVTCAISTAGNHRSGYLSQSSYDLTGDRCFVRLVQKATENQNFFSLFIDASNALLFYIDSSDIVAIERVGGSNTQHGNTTYSSTTHAWLSIKESGGTITFETAPSSASNPPVGGDWVSFFTLSNPFAVTALKVNLAAGTFQSEASPGSAIFDGLNGATTQTNGDVGGATAAPQRVVWW